MTTKLPIELQPLVAQKPTLLRLEDEQTRDVYFVVDEETHRRAMRALREQEDLIAIQAGIDDMEAGRVTSVAEADDLMRDRLGFPAREK